MTTDDFNVKIRNGEIVNVVGRFGFRVMNNRELLILFAQENDYIITNAYFQVPPRGGPR